MQAAYTMPFAAYPIFCCLPLQNQCKRDYVSPNISYKQSFA